MDRIKIYLSLLLLILVKIASLVVVFLFIIIFAPILFLNEKSFYNNISELYKILQL